MYLFISVKKLSFFRRDRNRVATLMRKFPNMDLAAVKEQYPDVDIERTKASKRARGHIVPM